MDLSKGHIKALQEGDLSSPKGIEACINASEALSQCMNVALKPGTALILYITHFVITALSGVHEQYF